MTRFAAPIILASLLSMRRNQRPPVPRGGTAATAPTQAGKGTIPSNPSHGQTASPGWMRLTEPAPLDFHRS